jgi:hypothetical protein
MDIKFLHDQPGIYTPNTTVAIPVLVDGQPARCEISEEALQDHFGAATGNGADLVAAFLGGRARIEAVAEARLQVSRGAPVLLRTADF